MTGDKVHLRVVLDTNVFISALAFPGGRAEEIIQLAVDERFRIVCSHAILAELANVLERKFSWDRPEIVDACKTMSDISAIVKPIGRLSVLQDEPDNRILECAVEGEASAIVTGDKPLLRLGNYNGIRILTLAQFHEEIKS